MELYLSVEHSLPLQLYSYPIRTVFEHGATAYLCMPLLCHYLHALRARSRRLDFISFTVALSSCGHFLSVERPLIRVAGRGSHRLYMFMYC